MFRDRSTTTPSVSDCPLVPVPPPRAATATSRCAGSASSRASSWTSSACAGQITA